MDREALIALRDEVERAFHEREHSGEFDANSKHIALLLETVLYLCDHALSQTKGKK